MSENEITTMTEAPEKHPRDHTTILSMIGAALPFHHDSKAHEAPASPETANTDTASMATVPQNGSAMAPQATINSVQSQFKDDKDEPVASIPGVQLASQKHNAEFHRTFPQVSRQESLIDDWACALGREILVQGRLYLTPRHVYFHSNILGWTTDVIISFSEVIDIQTKTTAGIFPNGITIQTVQTKHTFATFANRDAVIKLLRKVWHSPINGVSDASSVSSSWNEHSDASDTPPSRTSSRSLKTRRRHASGKQALAAEEYSPKKEVRNDGDGGSGGWPVPNLGPATHPPTHIPEPDPKEKIIDTSTLSAPLGVCANLVYGDNADWYEHFIVDVEGNRDLKGLGPFKGGDAGKKTREFEYVRPLHGPVGPKQTRCQLKETIEEWDMNDKVIVLSSTKTPDVPSGDAFIIWTRCTMAWGEDSKTVMQHTTWIEWTGKSWIKGPIEKGAIDGQKQHCKTLAARIESTIGKKTKRSTGEHHVEKRKEVTPRPEVSSGFSLQQIDPMALVIIGLAIVLVVLWFCYPRHDDKNNLRFVEQELQLWKWLDDRSVTTKLSPQELSRDQLREVIGMTEKKLDKLKELAEKISPS